MARFDSNPAMHNSYVFMGGTFNPIHHGHLRTLIEIRDALQLKRIHLLPCGEPVHRSTDICPAHHRLAMCQGAIDGVKGLHLDDREVIKSGPSYTVDTLRQLRQESGEKCCLIMVMGMDAFLSLPQWHQWTSFLELCHILVVTRPNYAPPQQEVLKTVLASQQVFSPEVLLQRPAGHILLHELKPLDISATQIRTLIKRRLDPSFLLPASVWSYIQHHQLYHYQEDLQY